MSGFQGDELDAAGLAAEYEQEQYEGEPLEFFMIFKQICLLSVLV